MTTCLIIIAIVLAQAGVGQEGHVNEPWVAWFVLVFVCIYIAAYAWSCELTRACLLAWPGLQCGNNQHHLPATGFTSAGTLLS